MVSFIQHSICNSTPKGDRTVTAPEMARTCGTGQEACCVVSRSGCHHSASHMYTLLTEVLLLMCCRFLWQSRCHKGQRWLCVWAQLWPGRSASKVGSIAATHARARKQAWYMQLSSAAHCSRISSYTWSGRCRLFVWINSECLTAGAT